MLGDLAVGQSLRHQADRAALHRRERLDAGQVEPARPRARGTELLPGVARERVRLAAPGLVEPAPQRPARVLAPAAATERRTEVDQGTRLLDRGGGSLELGHGLPQ